MGGRPAGSDVMTTASTIAEAAGRIGRHWRTRGAAATLRFLLSRIFRREVHLVYEAVCTGREMAPFASGEEILNFGPEDLDAALGPTLYEFLGGENAFESLRGVRNGDRLFVIARDGVFVH